MCFVLITTLSIFPSSKECTGLETIGKPGQHRGAEVKNTGNSTGTHRNKKSVYFRKCGIKINHIRLPSN